MNEIAGITADTLDQIKKAQTNGFLTSTGVVGYDLSGVVSLVPVNTPWFDRVTRTSGEGSLAANWKALLNVNNAQPNPFVGLDQGGNYIKFSEQDMLAKYVPVRVSGFVSHDSIDLSKGYADTRALAVTGTLMQWRIQENKGLLGGQNFALPTISTPTVATATTGGAIAASTAIYVKVQARSAMNYYWGGSNVASSNGTVTSGSGTATNAATATVAAVKGAVAYDWFAAATSGGTYYYVTTTTVNTNVFTAIPVANASAVPNLPDLFTTVPSAVTATDTSYSANSYNGLIASCAGDYSGSGLVTPGSGTASGATFTSLNGATLTGNSQGVAEIDAMLLAIWNAAQLSPTAMIINGQEAQDIKAKILATTAAVTYLQPDANSRTGVVGGGQVAGYVNGAAGGSHIEIVVDPHLPPGRIGFVTESINYPNSGIANTFEARCLRDVSEFPYGASLDTTSGNNGGPREVWDLSSMETFVNRAPVACGWITEIAAG